MQKVWFHIKSERGFSPVEVLLAATVFGFLVIALIGAIVYGRVSTAQAGNQNRATLLAEEGIEAVRSIANASFANLTVGGSTLGNTGTGSGTDFNGGGTTALKVTTGATGGTVSSTSAYISSYVDAAKPRLQMGIYADSAGAPGARLAVSALQNATANSWNTFTISGLTLAANTSYWVALSQEGDTTFGNTGSGGSSAYRLTGGYPAPNPFAADTAATSDRPSFYVTLAGTQGLAQSGGQWVFSGSSDTNDIYTRTINITSAGENRKKVTSTISWQKGNDTSQVSLETYLTNWLASLAVPASWGTPALAGSLDAPSTNNGLRVVTVGNYAYVARTDGTPDFLIVNITNPAAPTVAGSLNLVGSPTNIAISGNYAYVTTNSSTSELQIINITNPAAPSVAGNYDAPGTASGLGVAVSGTTAYLTRSSSTTTGTNEFVIVNVANPALPSTVGSYNNNVIMYEVEVSGNYAFVATGSDTAEVMVINISTPSLPSLAASVNLTGTTDAGALARAGNSLFVAQGTALRGVNIASPTVPTLLGALTSTGAGTINDVTVDATGAYAFLATSVTTAEFQVANIATPATINVAGTVDLPSTTSNLNGVGYNTALDVVVGTGISDTQEVVIFKKN